MTPPTSSPELRARGWTMWLAVWLATVVASGLAVLGSWQLTSETFEESLEDSLAQQVSAQAAMASASLDNVPLESVVAVGGERSLARLTSNLRRVRDAGAVHDLALMGPDGGLISASGTPWIAADADQDLIDGAHAGQARTGPLYTSADGEVYMAAYAPLAEHPGWVVAIEASGSRLEAAERMERRLAWVSVLVMSLAAIAGALLAATAMRPLRRLAHDLSVLRPGDPPDAVAIKGPVEVRMVGDAARSLLQAVRDRDVEIRASHDREVQQISALAAAVAHEVRNPLNAIGLAMQRLDRVDGEAASSLRGQVRALLEEIEGIVDRFMDLARPPMPEVRMVPASDIWARLAVDAEAVGIDVESPALARDVRTDPDLVGQALRNLLRNAAEAGAGTVYVRVARDAPLVIEVSDDGPGISPGQVGMLFDWFHTTRAKGTGLGLPSARRALRALGGDLELVDATRSAFRVTVEGGNP